MNNFQSVKNFMQIFGQEVKDKAGFPNEKTIKLRYDWQVQKYISHISYFHNNYFLTLFKNFT